MPKIEPMPVIEHDEMMNRTYIPVSPDYEIQTKGNGSSFRLASRKENGGRWLIGDDYIHKPLEEMARNVHSYIGQLEQEIEAKQAKIEALMLEYSPNEMTPEQVKEWGENQKPVTE